MPTEALVVLTTVGSEAEALQLAETLVREQLAACVNISSSIQSVYTWQGKLERSEERLLIIKTQRPIFDALEARIRTLHSYEVPEVIALEVSAGSAAYLEWIQRSTRHHRAERAEE